MEGRAREAYNRPGRRRRAICRRVRLRVGSLIGVFISPLSPFVLSGKPRPDALRLAPAPQAGPARPAAPGRSAAPRRAGGVCCRPGRGRGLCSPQEEGSRALTQVCAATGGEVGREEVLWAREAGFGTFVGVGGKARRAPRKIGEVRAAGRGSIQARGRDPHEPLRAAGTRPAPRASG